MGQGISHKVWVTSIFLKAAFHKFYLVHSWISWPIYESLGNICHLLSTEILSTENCYIYFGLLFIHILKLTKFRNHVLQIQLATWPQNLHHCAIDNLLSWGKSNKTDLHLPRIMLLYEKFHMPLRLLEF